MSKKIWFAGLLTLVLVLTMASIAYAGSTDQQPGNPPGPRGGPGRGQGLGGEVIAVGDDQFTLLLRNDVEVTVEVDEDTSYLGDLESFDDIEVGLTVRVAGQRSGDETILARAVASAPYLGQTRAHGEVTGVASDSLTIETRDGEIYTFVVTADTEFHSRDGSVESLSDVNAGDLVVVLYEEDGDDLVALLIGVRQPLQDGSGNGRGFGPGGPQG
jgi:hypothetical protein